MKKQSLQSPRAPLRFYPLSKHPQGTRPARGSPPRAWPGAGVRESLPWLVVAARVPAPDAWPEPWLSALGMAILCCFGYVLQPYRRCIAAWRVFGNIAGTL